MARQRDEAGRYAPALPTNDDERISRCRSCGAWCWDGRCSLHPEGPHDAY